MRNDNFSKKNPKIRYIFEKAGALPYFTIDDLASIETDRNYLKVLLSRYKIAGRLLRLKKGVYVLNDYLVKIPDDLKNAYNEFVANLLCAPSYLSLDFVLHQYGILTEAPANFTSISKDKTIGFSNPRGNFYYHKVKADLFCGFATAKNGDFEIRKATKAKAVFDYLYLRKNSLSAKSAVDELRLNISLLNAADKKDIADFAKIEGSKKMAQICNWLLIK
jgi:predicted transcriptional regulator of viral defense system